jgi:hypothetical protein
VVYCKECKKEFIFKNNISNKNGCCSYPCYRKQNKDKIREKYLNTFLKNRFKKTQEECDKLSLKHKNEIFSKCQAEKTKISTLKKHKTIKNRYGDVSSCYKNAGKLGLKNRKINFLVNNLIISENEISNLSEEKINILFKKYFNKIEKHGEKIAKGRKNKYKDQYKNSYKRGLLKCAFRYFNYKDSKIDSCTQEEQNNILHKYYKEVKFYNYDSKSWKKTHLVNLGLIEIEELNIKKINKLYSEYLSKRYTRRSLEVKNNGYTRSKKGWYIFKNIKRKLFYRSSWEKYVFEIIDNLIRCREIINVGTPKRVKYFFKNRFRYYYPDILIELKNNIRKNIEIKPFRKVGEDINQAKFKEANHQLENFTILTEKEIFTDKIIKILISESED